MSQIWFPDQMERILNRKDMEVCTLEEINIESLVADLEECENIGVATLDKETNVNFLCLTSLIKIYVFDLSISRHKKVLKKLFDKNNLRFFTRDGSYDGLAIAKNMEVYIGEYKNFYDLTTLDLNLNLRDARLANKGTILTPEDFVVRGPKQRDYRQLVDAWLGGSKINMSCFEEELVALKKSPLDNYGKNCIKKKCALTGKLGDLMWKQFNDKIWQKSKDLYSMGYRADDELMERYGNEKTGGYSQFCQYLQLCPESNDDC